VAGVAKWDMGEEGGSLIEPQSVEPKLAAKILAWETHIYT
jgi:hypothetical protein